MENPGNVDSRMEMETVDANDHLDGDEKAKDYRLNIDDVPALRLTILLGFQHFLSMYVTSMSVPFLLTPALIPGGDPRVFGRLFASLVVAGGIGTLLQTTLGCRLPIVQGGSFSYLVPTLVILEMTQDDPDWQRRLCAIQGAMMGASIIQMIMGGSGFMGKTLTFIGPMTMVPLISLIGLALFKSAAKSAASHWGVSVATMALTIIFSQHLSGVLVPTLRLRKLEPGSTSGLLSTWRRRVSFGGGFPLFRLFPVILAIGIMWSICAILTATGALNSSESTSGNNSTNLTTLSNFSSPIDVQPAREYHVLDTRKKWSAVTDSHWFFFPYPGQWGPPTLAIEHLLGLLVSVFAASFESVGDYYACARVAGAPTPPKHAVNRGIFFEGFIVMLMGLVGTGNGSTSYSLNTGLLNITKVGSRVVIQAAAVFMIIFGSLAKFSAFFSTMPDPILGGVLIVLFAGITGVALSNLEGVPLNSSRNVFILALSLFLGLSIPHYFSTPGVVGANTGVAILDASINILLRTSMFVGGVVGFVLDNTIPGSLEERGLAQWLKPGEEASVVKETAHAADATDTDKDDVEASSSVRATVRTYDIPFCTNFFENRKRVTRYIPISHTYG